MYLKQKTILAMKKNILTIVCAATLSMSSFVSLYAHNHVEPQPKSKQFETGIYATKAGKLNINFVKENMETPTVIKLAYANGKVFHNETISKRNKKFSIQFDMEGLAPGDYMLSINSNGESLTKSIKITAPARANTLFIH
jgi:hypothetical protein